MEANSFSFRQCGTLLPPSDFQNIQSSADLTIRMAWQTHIGPSEMPVKLDPSVCRIFLNSAEIPFMKANIQSFSTNAERLCESLGHGKRFAWTFAMLDQWLTGVHRSCTLATLIYLMPVILKRSANAVVIQLAHYSSCWLLRASLLLKRKHLPLLSVQFQNTFGELYWTIWDNLIVTV